MPDFEHAILKAVWSAMTTAEWIEYVDSICVII
jgi:hypothetical protein